MAEKISKERFESLLSRNQMMILKLAISNDQVSSDDLKRLYSEDKAARILADLWIDEKINPTNQELQELFDNYSKFYAREEGGTSNAFYKRYTSRMGVSVQRTKELSAAMWAIKNMPRNNMVYYWCGVFVEDPSDKYIWATIERNSSGGLSFVTRWGRVGSSPQGQKSKDFSRIEDALLEIDNYKRGKEREGYVSVSLNDPASSSSQIPTSNSTSNVPNSNTPNVSNEPGEEEVEIKNTQMDIDHVHPGNLFHMPKPEEFDFSNPSWTKLVQRFVQVGKPADTELGEILRAVSFMEFRAKKPQTANSGPDWPTADQTDDELEESFCTEAIGYLSSMLNGSEPDLIALLRSKSQQEWLTNLKKIKNQILASDLKDLSERPNNRNFMDEENQASFKSLLAKARGGSNVEEEEEVEIKNQADEGNEEN